MSRLEVRMSCLPSSSIRPFFFDAQQVRVVLDERGTPWFVAADVCAALTVGNPSDAVSRLDADERGLGSIETPSGTQQMVTVSEPGLYSLVLGSRKPEAKRFKRWVTHDVLPAIRQAGAYVAPASQDLASALHAQPKSVLLRMAAELAEKNEEQERLLAEQQKQLAAQAPAVEFVAAYAKADTLLSLRDAAKRLRIPPFKLIAAMLEERILFRRQKDDRLEPYADFIERGLLAFPVTLITTETPEGAVTKDRPQAKVTPKGLLWLAQRFGPTLSAPAPAPLPPGRRLLDA